MKTDFTQEKTHKYNIGDKVFVIEAPYYYIDKYNNQEVWHIYLYDISKPIPNKKLYWMKGIYVGEAIITKIFIDKNEICYEFDSLMYYDFGRGWERLPENAVYSSKEEAEQALKGFTHCCCCKCKCKK